MGGLAILAGTGMLPSLLAEGSAATLVVFNDMAVDPGGAAVLPARFERLGELMAALREKGITRLSMAGAMTRPALDPAQLDPETQALIPRIMAAMAAGDDALLRAIAAIFEENGFSFVGAAEIRPDLVAPEGGLFGDPLAPADVARARDVLTALGPLDVGQGAVAARGQVLAIETLQGTDAMLAFVRDTAPGSGGVMVKRPKPGQDLRFDMPAIGPETIRRAAEAGLSGIEIAAGAVLILTPDAVRAACAEHGIALWAAP